MDMCQFGVNLPICSEDRVLTRLFHSCMTLVTLKIKQRHESLIIPFLAVPIKYLCKLLRARRN